MPCSASEPRSGTVAIIGGRWSSSKIRAHRIRSKALDGSRDGIEPGSGPGQRDERASARAQGDAVETPRNEGVGAVRACGQSPLESAAGVLRADPRNQRKPAVPGAVHDVEALSAARGGDRAASESTARGREPPPRARGRPPRWQRRRPSRSRRGSKAEPPRRARRLHPPCTSRARSSSSSGSEPRRRRPPESAPPGVRRATRWSRSTFPGTRLAVPPFTSTAASGASGFRARASAPRARGKVCMRRMVTVTEGDCHPLVSSAAPTAAVGSPSSRAASSAKRPPRPMSSS